MNDEPTAEAAGDGVRQALTETDLRLRRLLRSVAERQDPEGEEMQREIRRSRRRLRENKAILGGAGDGD